MTTTPSRESGSLRVEVWPKGGETFYFEIINPLVLPSVGHRVEFSDGYGVVESVTWKPDRSRKRNADVLIVVECVPEART
jgi:hypothetical protein